MRHIESTAQVAHQSTRVVNVKIPAAELGFPLPLPREKS